MMEWIKDERIELKKICYDRIGFSAFSGMIFNKHIETNADIDYLIRKALAVRVRINQINNEV